MLTMTSQYMKAQMNIRATQRNLLRVRVNGAEIALKSTDRRSNFFI